MGATETVGKDAVKGTEKVGKDVAKDAGKAVGK